MYFCYICAKFIHTSDVIGMPWTKKFDCNHRYVDLLRLTELFYCDTQDWKAQYILLQDKARRSAVEWKIVNTQAPNIK